MFWYLLVAVLMFETYCALFWLSDWKQMLGVACLCCLWPAMLLGWMLVAIVYLTKKVLW